MIPSKTYIYIVGSPRSGTTWLQTMIGAHHAVATTMELTMFTTYIKPLMDAWDMEMRPIELGKWQRGLPVIWTREEFDDFLMSFLNRAYTSLLDKNPQATHLLDKNPTNALFVDTINNLIPQARFIHIIRDGRDVALSMIAARKNVGFGTDTIHASAKQWREMVIAARIGQQFGERYLEVRYEDLLAEPEIHMARIFEFCELPINENEIAAIVENHSFDKMKSERRTPDARFKASEGAFWKGKAGTWYKEMSVYQRYTFHKFAGDLLCELGYAKDDWWYNSVLQKLFIPLLQPPLHLFYRIRRFVMLAIKHSVRWLRKET